MATSETKETRDGEQYRLLLELWQRERASGRNEFVGFIVATAILILVGLGGAWWPPALGIVLSTIWLALSARSATQQRRLYSEMDALSTADSDNPAPKLHSFEQEEVELPFLSFASRLVKPISRYVFVGAPALFIVIWLVIFVVAVVTAIAT